MSGTIEIAILAFGISRSISIQRVISFVMFGVYPLNQGYNTDSSKILLGTRKSLNQGHLGPADLMT